MPATDVLIQVQQLHHEFVEANNPARRLPVLQDINMEIRRGAFVSFLGPSGCGKTTLLRILDGLIQPARGQVVVDGARMTEPTPKVAMVFQDFALLPWRNILHNVVFPLEVTGHDRRDREERAKSALAMVGLRGFEQYYPYQLSGGMKQRVGLARALAADPPILLMDEPFGALDPQTRELMQIELLKIWENDRKTVIFVTHSIEEAIFLSDEIVLFSSRPGRIKEWITVDLPRPRSVAEEEVKSSKAFLDLRAHLWRLIKEEVRIA